MSGCEEITHTGLASALRERPTLSSLWFSFTKDDQVFATSYLIHSLVSLKGLTSLILFYLNISDELLYSIAREGLPLIRFHLRRCFNYSYNGIFCLLSKCQRIQHLNLQNADFLEDQHVVQLSPFLRHLVSINLSDCPELTKSALFTLAKNCPSLSEIKMERIRSKSKQKSDSLVEFGVYPQLKSLYLGENSWLNDEILIMLRKCSKIRHLNLAGCSRVNLLGLNFAVPKLEVLNLSDTKVDDETLYVISKSCCGLLQLLLEKCYRVTENGVKHVLEKCTKLRKITVPYSLSDKNQKLFSRHGCQILYC